MKLKGLGRIEELDMDAYDRPRRMVVSAVVAGTPVMLTLDAGPASCFVLAKEGDVNIEVVVAQ